MGRHNVKSKFRRLPWGLGRRGIVGALAVSLLGSCGGGGQVAAPPVLAAFSPLPVGLQPLPPNVADTTGPAAARLRDARPRRAEVGPAYSLRRSNEVLVGGRGVTGEPIAMSLALAEVFGLHVDRAADGRVILLAAGRTSQDEAAIAVYVDGDADHRIETQEHTTTLLVPGTPPATGGVFSYLERSGSVWLALDVRNHEIRRLVDTQADGIPDQIAAVAWLDSTQSHAWDDVVAIGFDAAGTCVDLLTSAHVRSPRMDDVMYRAADTDADGRADAFETKLRHQLLTDVSPSPAAPVDSAATSVLAQGAYQSVLEAWTCTVDPSLEPGDLAMEPISLVALLGSATTLGTQSRATIPLSSSPSAGSWICLRDATHGLVGAPFQVVSASAVQVHGVEPLGVPGASGGSVTIRGKNFAAGTTVRFHPPGCSPDPSSVLVPVVTTTTLTIQLPAPAGPGPGLVAVGSATLEVLEGAETKGSVIVQYR
jgi:hypothetical protein